MLARDQVRWVAILALLLCADGSSHAEIAGGFEPEMVIHFTRPTVACPTKGQLQVFNYFDTFGQKTKAASMMVTHGGGCVVINPSVTLTVIEVGYYTDKPSPDRSGAVLEVVREGVVASHGFWAMSFDAVLQGSLKH